MDSGWRQTSIGLLSRGIPTRGRFVRCDASSKLVRATAIIVQLGCGQSSRRSKLLERRGCRAHLSGTLQKAIPRQGNRLLYIVKNSADSGRPAKAAPILCRRVMFAPRRLISSA